MSFPTSAARSMTARQRTQGKASPCEGSTRAAGVPESSPPPAPSAVHPTPLPSQGCCWMPKTTLRESPWRARTPLWNGRNLCSAVEAALVETPRPTSQWCECAHPGSADESFLVGYPIEVQRPRPRFPRRYRDHPSHRNPRKGNACANELSRTDRGLARDDS